MVTYPGFLEFVLVKIHLDDDVTTTHVDVIEDLDFTVHTVDLLTKPLPSERFSKLREHLDIGILNATIPK